MKKLLLASAALVAFATAASAADLPNRVVKPAPYIPMAPAFTWTGFYAGLNAGGIFSNSDHVNTLSNIGAVGPFSLGRSGFIGGGQVGYNYQINQFVVGLETDIQWADLRKGSNDGFGDHARLESNYLGTVRGRLGFVPMDRALVYVTGGLAYGDSKLSASVPGFFGGSKNDTNAGWTLGGGVEYAFTNNITGKLEYLYYDLGNTNLHLSDAAGNAVHYKAENNGSIARVGLNYKF